MFEIMIADDQELYRTGVVDLVKTSSAFRIIAQFPNWATFSTALAGKRESIVVASTSVIPELEYLVARTREARNRLLLVTDDSDSPNRYYSSGVAGIVQRSTSALGFMDVLRRVQSGDKFVRAAGRNSTKDRVGANAASTLTVSEMKIVALLMEGLKNRRIAERLNIPERLVRSRFQRIFDKTGLSSRLELALFISRHQEFAAAAADACSTMEAVRCRIIPFASTHARSPA